MNYGRAPGAIYQGPIVNSSSLEMWKRGPTEPHVIIGQSHTPMAFSIPPLMFGFQQSVL